MTGGFYGGSHIAQAYRGRGEHISFSIAVD
jgi:hypothetical protein